VRDRDRGDRRRGTETGREQRREQATDAKTGNGGRRTREDCYSEYGGEKQGPT
jgi:hypothetical protein